MNIFVRIYICVCYIISVSFSEPCEPYKPTQWKSAGHVLLVSSISLSPAFLALPLPCDFLSFRGGTPLRTPIWCLSPFNVWLVSEIVYPLTHGWFTKGTLLKTNSPFPAAISYQQILRMWWDPMPFFPFYTGIENVQVFSMLLQLSVHICMLSGVFFSHPPLLALTVFSNFCFAIITELKGRTCNLEMTLMADIQLWRLR